MKEKENFLDKNTLISVALIFVAWLSWDAYMRKKYPQKPSLPPAEQAEQEEQAQDAAQHAQQQTTPAKRARKKLKPPVPLKGTHPPRPEEQILSFESETLSFDLSSRGMGFKKVVLNRILDRKGEAVYLFLGEENLPFETRLAGTDQDLLFDMRRLSKTRFEGKALWKGVEVQKNLTVEPENFLVKAQLHLRGDLSQVSGVGTLLSQTQKRGDQKKGLLSFLIPPDFLSFFLSSAKGFEQIPLMSKEWEEVQEQKSRPPVPSVRALALGTRYFGQAWIEDQSDVLPQFHIRFQAGESGLRHPGRRTDEAYEKGRYMGLLQHSVLNPNKDFELAYKIFLGPKDFAFLDPALLNWVDFGWFGQLSRFILQILRFFHSLTGNWGIAIILLTILVRLLLLPFVLSSHRSMEVMKKVNPEIQKLRAKFKKDPQRLNQEIMAVMKSHKANPLGGCLPLLLQIPVFWALWKALSNSYSLYRAPFLLWIQDLSWKDPYYVLPVLMGALMFWQQKISPVSLNKEMARAMQIMPVFITFFMINLPSGLVLYMLISTLFGLGQQVYLNKTGEPPVLNKGKGQKNV